MNNQDNGSDMSMEEILSSIRRYVNNDESSVQDFDTSKKVYEKKMPIFESDKITEAKVVDASDIPDAQILEPRLFNTDDYNNNYEHGNQSIYDKNFSPFGKLEREFCESDIKINTKSNNNHNFDIEKFLSELIRPMIQKWLDEKLLIITEQMVQKEIEKIKNQK